MNDKIRFLTNVAYWGTIAILLYLLLRFVLPPSLPFVLGFCVAALWNPLIGKLTKLKKRWIASAIIILPFWGIVFLILWKTCGMISREIAELMQTLKTLDIEAFLFSGKIPFLSESAASWLADRTDSLLPAILNLSQSALLKIMNLLLGLPEAILFCFATVLSSLLFSISYPKIEPFILRQLPARLQAEYYDVKEFLFQKIVKICKAQGIMISIVFTALLLGLWILKFPYPILFAAFIAIADLLPFIGIAILLIPWGLFEWYFCSDPVQGIGLIVLAILITALRELLEPKIIGQNIGLSSLATLFGIYLGIKLIGIPGIIIVPLVFLFLKEWNADGRISLWKTTPE